MAIVTIDYVPCRTSVSVGWSAHKKANAHKTDQSSAASSAPPPLSPLMPGYAAPSRATHLCSQYPPTAFLCSKLISAGGRVPVRDRTREELHGLTTGSALLAAAVVSIGSLIEVKR
jgi:hypothetical protein